MPLELTRVFRQTDARFVRLLGEVRCGEVSADTQATLTALARWPPSPPPSLASPQGIAPALRIS